MTDRVSVRHSGRSLLRAIIAGGLVTAAAAGCLRGTLPPREFYRLTQSGPVVVDARPAGTAALSGAIRVRVYDTPGIYGAGSLVYRTSASAYGAYPSREWAIPLGEMLGSLTQDILRQRALTSARVEFGSTSSKSEPYEWRGIVREFDEVDTPATVSASVALIGQLVRVADDSVLWSGVVRETEPVKDSRNIDSVVDALSAAATRAILRLTDGAVGDLKRLAAEGARGR